MQTGYLFFTKLNRAAWPCRWNLLHPSLRQSRHSHPDSYQIITSTKNCHKYSYKTVIDWNNLPYSIIQIRLWNLQSSRIGTPPARLINFHVYTRPTHLAPILGVLCSGLSTTDTDTELNKYIYLKLSAFLKNKTKQNKTNKKTNKQTNKKNPVFLLQRFAFLTLKNVMYHIQIFW